MLSCSTETPQDQEAVVIITKLTFLSKRLLSCHIFLFHFHTAVKVISTNTTVYMAPSLHHSIHCVTSRSNHV